MFPGKRLLAVTIAALAMGVADGRAQTPAKQPKALLELFTSQGCSSCPPADALVIELSKDPDLIALTLPVTYWDYLGWKDTLGKDSFAKRQKFYAKARGDGQVYTPQVVVNGTGHLVGSDKDEIQKTIQQLAPAKALLLQPLLHRPRLHEYRQRHAGLFGRGRGEHLGRQIDQALTQVFAQIAHGRTPAQRVDEPRQLRVPQRRIHGQHHEVHAA